MIDQKTLGALAFTKTLGRRNDDPLDEDTVFEKLFHAKVNIDALKKGKAVFDNLFPLLEFFSLANGAANIAEKKTADSGKAALKKHANILYLAAKTTDDLLMASDANGGKPPIATGNQLKAIDEGYTAAVGALESIPEWAFRDAGYELLKDHVGRMSKANRRPNKRKKRGRK